MKKKPESKPDSRLRAVAVQKPWWRQWWIWLAALAALFAVFEVYGPALNGAFVFDDYTMPFFNPNVTGTLWTFVGDLRPLLMFSFWVDYHRGAAGDPYTFHTTNVFLHFIDSLFVTLIVLRLLEWANVEQRKRVALAIFAGALFLLHPIQTESVAYVASRSEVLSVLFYYAAVAVFVWRSGESMTILRAISIVVLFGCAALTKEHTLTLPVLLILIDYFWGRGGIRKNAMLYALLAAGAMVGGIFVWKLIRHASTAGFGHSGLSPINYAFAEGRVIWIYLRMLVLPFGQNIDPDIAMAPGFDVLGAIGWLAIVGVTVAAWIYRKSVPLAAFGWFTFLLLLAPTSTVVPIKDVLAEHRMYLPFLGVALICCEALRRVTFSQITGIGAAVLLVCSFLTYQRATVWANPVSLWQDSVDKSPAKYRPRFQLAYAEFTAQQFASAIKDYEAASKLGPVGDELLVDWGLAIASAGRPNEAIDKFRDAEKINNSAHVHTQIAAALGQQKKYEEARAELMQAMAIDPNYDMTYAYLGSVEEAEGNRDAARANYRKALQLNPQNVLALQGLARLGP